MDFFNIRHMNVFVLAVQTGSVSGAADRAHLTQPAASQGIAKLETALGSPLLHRGAGGVSLTGAGKVFAPRVARALGFLNAQKPLSNKLAAAQLRALIAVGDTGSFTIAARQLGLAQPTVHRAARTLEQIVGSTLFRSYSHGVALTQAGEVLFQNAKLAHAELRQAQEEVAVLLGRGGTQIVIGSLPLARSEILPRAISSVVELDPSTQVRVIDGRYGELLRGLRLGDLDFLIGALRDPAPFGDVQEEVLFQDDLAVICRPGHPLARQRTVDLKETLAFPWIAPPKTTPSGQYLFEALGIADLETTPVRVVSSSLMMVRQMLLQGDFVSVISRHQIDHEVRAGQIAVLPIALEGSRRPIGLSTRKSWRPTEPQMRMLEQIRRSARRI